MKVLIILAFVTLAICSSIKQEKQLAVTIYNDDFAMVKDIREINFDEG